MNPLTHILKLFKRSNESDLKPRGIRTTCKLGVYIPKTKNFIGGAKNEFEYKVIRS